MIYNIYYGERVKGDDSLKKVIRIALLIISVVMISIGINRGETLVLLNKAIRV